MKVVSGTQEGATGMVVKVEQHVLIILSDTTKEHVSYGHHVLMYLVSTLVNITVSLLDRRMHR